MKRVLLALMMMAGLALPSWADLQVDKIDVQPASDTVSIRVKIVNPSSSLQKQPIQTQLFVRKKGSDRWTLLQTWREDTPLGMGEQFSHIWEDPSNGMVRKLAASGGFEIKVKCQAPGMLAPCEYRQQWTKPTDGL